MDGSYLHRDSGLRVVGSNSTRKVRASIKIRKKGGSSFLPSETGEDV